MGTHNSFTDEYLFHHTTDETEVNVVVKDVFVDKIIEAFVQFLRGCGHYDSCIYENMRELADQYFELEEKRMEKERQLKPVLD